MPQLTRKDLDVEQQKEGTPTKEEILMNEIWAQEDGKEDSLQVLGFVDEPYMGMNYDDDEGTNSVSLNHRYHIGVLDTKHHQKYILHIGTKEGFDGYTYEPLQVEKLEKEPEYTHLPKAKTMIHGLSINPKTLSYSQKQYFHNADDADYKDTPDRIITINNMDYNVYSEKYREIHNNVFSCDPDSGIGFIHKGIFKLRPEMKEKLSQQEEKVRNEILFYPREQERKEQELEIRRETYRAMMRVETAQKRKEQKQAEKEIKKYERYCANRKKEHLANVSQDFFEK